MEVNDVIVDGEANHIDDQDFDSLKPGKRLQAGAAKSKLFNGDLNSRITCTACYHQIFVQKANSAYRHPVLHVLICRKCYEYYTSGEIRLGNDGVDEQCRWCGEGGKLVGCDDCNNAFCKHCIKQNLGRSALAAATGEGKWQCYVCDPTPLEDLVASCSAILDAVEAYHKQHAEKLPGTLEKSGIAQLSVCRADRSKGNEQDLKKEEIQTDASENCDIESENRQKCSDRKEKDSDETLASNTSEKVRRNKAVNVDDDDDDDDDDAVDDVCDDNKPSDETPSSLSDAEKADCGEDKSDDITRVCPVDKNSEIATKDMEIEKECGLNSGKDSSEDDKMINSASRVKNKLSLKSDYSSDHESQLEREIRNLEKMPRVKVTLSRLDSKLLKSRNAKKVDGATEELEPEQTSRKNRPKQKDLVSDLSSDEQSYGSAEDDAEDDPQSQENSMDFGAVANVAAAEVENEDEKARRALLADAENDDDDEEEDDENNEDDDDLVDLALKKLAKNKSKRKTTGEVNTVGSDASSSDDFEAFNKKKLRSSKLLRAKLTDTDDEEKSRKKNDAKKSKIEDDDDDSDVALVKRVKRKRKSASNDSEELVSSDDSDFDTKKKKSTKRRRIRTQNDSSASNEEDESKDSAEDDEDVTSGGRKRKKIRKIINKKELSKTTVDAAKAEQERRERIAERQKLFNQVTVEDTSSPMKCPKTTKLVLEVDEKTKDTLIEVDQNLICKLKPHQVEAVKFMWDCCVESLDRLRKEEGSGCILAHCMGLGKTLSVITFVHTIIANMQKTKIKTCLVLCPLNTILNWQSEFENWLEDVGPLDVYEMSSIKDFGGRSDALSNWQSDGGVMIMGYEMFRNLSQLRRVKNKKQKKIFTESLLDPGPDLVVCDEGHVLKNDATGLSKATNQVKTKRRIVLTGTPLQNNLIEYHCMVNFVKPNLLGSRKEFFNRFVNPIMNGQCSDSSAMDVKLMKKRAHILHDMLAGCVQRKDYSALTKFLPPKHEYVISVRLSKIQLDLYTKYLDRLQSAIGGDLTGQVVRGARIFTDYQYLMKIWTHPWVLKMDEDRQELKRQNAYNSEDSFIDDSDYDSESSSKSSPAAAVDNEIMILDSEEEWKPQRRSRRAAANGQDNASAKAGTSKMKKNEDDENRDSSDKDEVVKGWKTRSRGREKGVVDVNEKKKEEEEEADDKLSSEWWAEYVKPEDQYKLEYSGKLQLLFEVLKMSESIGDKVLVFSQSLLSLDLIEEFLGHLDSRLASDADSQGNVSLGWVKGLDYLRMDGSTNAQNRREWSDLFNDPENIRARLFLISTRAGSLGINLVAANRVVVFDASWNPTHDVQSIFRVYRFGQEKPVYVYRFLAQGTMEEKIYERQVTKQSLSQRVIDEHQIERHFSANDLSQLYVFKPDRLDDPNRSERPTPKLPKDRMLAELLVKFKDLIVQYHEHDSLLENKLEEELTEEERKAAWEEYEQEKRGLRLQPNQNSAYSVLRTNYPPGLQHMPTPASSMGSSSLAADYSSTIQSAHQIAKAIYASNPGITQAELTAKVTDYLRQLEMSRQQEINEYRALLERNRWQRLEEERRRQETMVGSFRNLQPGTATDPVLDQDLISILDDRPSRSAIQTEVLKSSAVMRNSTVPQTLDAPSTNAVVIRKDRGNLTSSSGFVPKFNSVSSSALELMSSLVPRHHERSSDTELTLPPTVPSTSSTEPRPN